LASIYLIKPVKQIDTDVLENRVFFICNFIIVSIFIRKYGVFTAVLVAHNFLQIVQNYTIAMKKLIILILVFNNFGILLAQNMPEIDNSSEKDTLKGTNYKDYIYPKDGITATNPELGIDRDPTFRKCKDFESADKRRRCFSNTF
jgi:hypothetical protein